jgi:hypothetical protein
MLKPTIIKAIEYILYSMLIISASFALWNLLVLSEGASLDERHRQMWLDKHKEFYEKGKK